MKKIFGSLAVASLVVSGVAMAEGGAKKGKHEAAPAGHCKSNECKGSVAGAKNECKGQNACKGIKKAACEKGHKGTWETGAAAAEAPAAEAPAAPAATEAPTK